MRGLGRVGELMLILALVLTLGGARAWAAPAAQNGQRITYGETVEGVLTDANGEQRWSFTGAMGDVVLIEMVAAEGSQLDPLLTLLDGGGDTLTSDDDGGVGLNARIGPYILPDTGEYTIVASQYSGTGHYTLSLQTLNTAPRLRLGKPLQGRIDETTPQEYYRLQAEGEEAELVRLVVSTDGERGGPPLRVYDPSGQAIQGDPEAPHVIDPLLLLPQMRYIVAVGQVDDATGGAYTITLTPADAALLQDGVPQHGRLPATATARRHYFIGQAGGTVRVTLETDEGFLPALYVQPQGSDAVLFSGDGSAVNRFSATLTLPTDNAYVIGIFEGQFATAQADYTLTVTWLER